MDIAKSFVTGVKFWRFEYSRRNDPSVENAIDWNAEMRLMGHERTNTAYRSSTELIESILNQNFVYKFSLSASRAGNITDKIGPILAENLSNPEQLELDCMIRNIETLDGVTPGRVKAVFIDFSKSIELIIKEIKFIYNVYSEDVTYSIKRACELLISLDDVEKHVIKDNKCISRLTANGNKQRAVGLWIWDRVKELKHKRGTVKQALGEFHGTGYLEKLGFEDIEEADLRFWYRRTDDCIKAVEVIPFTKRKKGTKES